MVRSSLTLPSSVKWCFHSILFFMSLQMLLASVILTWSGFAFGAIVSKLFRFPVEDVVAIAVETGVQNAALAIALLRFSLPQPAADLALGNSTLFTSPKRLLF